MYLATSSHSVYSLLYCIVLFEQKACVVSWYSLFSHPGIFFVFGTFLAGPAYHYWFNYLDELPAHAYRLKQLRQRGEYVERPNKYVEKWTKLESVGKFLPFFFSLSVSLRLFFNSPPSSSHTISLFSLCPWSTYYDLPRPGKILRSYAYLRSYNIEVKLNLNQLPKASKLGTCTLQFLYYFISTIYPRTHHLLLPLGVIICTLIHLI